MLITKIFYIVSLILPAEFQQKPLRVHWRRTLEYGVTFILIVYVIGDFRSLFGALWYLPIGLAFSQIFTNIFALTLRITLLVKRNSIYSLMLCLQDVHSNLESKMILNQRSQLMAGIFICYILPTISSSYAAILCNADPEEDLKFYLEDTFFGWSADNDWINCVVFLSIDHFTSNQEFVQTGLIVVLCWYLFRILKRIVASFMDKSQKEHDVESLYKSFLEFSETIYRCISLSEQALSLLLLIIYGFMIFSIFNVTTFLVSVNYSRLPTSMLVNQVAMLSVMITGFYFLSFQAIAVHDAAVKVKDSICDAISKSDSSDSEIKSLLLMIAEEFPTKVVATGWGLFSLKRNFLKRTTSGIVTYAILLAQIGRASSLK
ncbi:hypothetical protein HNY73_019522 [Argiope bruennichi]|uniref:Gustatory receptor n=1 Tax=Argiope bruennichi TaxID=94029 RepID=A0A8T0E3W2_ARGBR|nr:hypothetical protein HNY73_019522 [Argiope bruennichi]